MKKLTIFALLFASFGLSSCDDWFDVTSSNQIREEDHYSSESGFRQTLIGCYIAMSEEGLFAKNLTWYLPELTAHQYRAFSGGDNTSAQCYYLQQFNYTNTYTKSLVEKIWADAYNVIANANEALKFIDEKQAVIDPINFHVFKGELLAIRAYMHFNLLRLYGYGGWGARASELNAKATIPYVTQVHKDMTPQASGADAIKAILQDLSDAAALLKGYDPVVSELDWSAYDIVNEDGFYATRNFHLNYYAVKALQAQVHMWEGSQTGKSEALKAAEEIITATGDGVSMIYTNSSNTLTNLYILKFLNSESLHGPDYSMIPEALFALSARNLDTKTSGYFNPYYKDADATAFFLLPEAGENLYENISSDVRFNTLLQLNTSVITPGYVPMKLYQGTGMNAYYKNKIPLIRLPEIYYIAAECYATGPTPDLSLALARLNKVREVRGLYTPLANLTADEIRAELRKEYQKEFLAEGVMFYYYKRTGAVSIPGDDEMDDSKYVLPYPDFEIQSGRVQ